MKAPQYLYLVLVVASVLFVQACSKALVIENVNYAQPVESVLVPDANGVVSDIRYGISFNIQTLEAQEFEGDSTQAIQKVRIIRNANGYYFITANNFKHVYVMAPKKGELREVTHILVNPEGIDNPAFNWREPTVELVSMGTTEHYFLTEQGIIEPQEEQS